MLGTLVTGVTYRNPSLLAKSVTTLDVISGGRAMLGLGAAWNEDEHRGLGFDFPPIGQRMDRLDEALTICRAMFTEDRPTFEGRYYRIERAVNSPRPICPVACRFSSAAGGEQRTLIAARRADLTHWFPLAGCVRHKNELDRYCDEIGRSGLDPADDGDPGHPGRRRGRGDRPLDVARTSGQRHRRTAGTGGGRAQALPEAGFTGFTFNNLVLTPSRRRCRRFRLPD
jgi:alkanesulfonate monooxygenase SsuD/methylene tetrahydromethanopterin reductase-like flavin-dependent oxidoreductase (luciferase family)